MGVSVKWAAMNVGAEDKSQTGLYYAWGETTPKQAGVYKWADGAYSGSAVLAPENDAASCNWGESWRLPTRAEIEELIENCTWTESNTGSSSGFLATSKINGNTLFFPAGGVKYDSGEMGNEGFAEYWSSEMQESMSSYRLQVSWSMVYCSAKYSADGRLLRAVLVEE